MKKWMTVIAATMVAIACNTAQEKGAASGSGEPTTTNPSTQDAATPGATAAGTSVPPETTPSPAPVAPTYQEVTVPSGTALRLELQSAVSSDASNVEDVVRATLRQPVVVGGKTIIPAGTEVVGAVTNAERSGRVKGRAQVAYRFSSLRLDDERYDIRTAPLTHLAPATKKEDATKIAIGAGAGAAIGAILGGGDGAAKGAAIGGAGGTGAVLATRGKEVRLGPGANVTARLTAPLTLRIRAS